MITKYRDLHSGPSTHRQGFLLSCISGWSSRSSFEHFFAHKYLFPNNLVHKRWIWFNSLFYWTQSFIIFVTDFVVQLSKSNFKRQIFFCLLQLSQFPNAPIHKICTKLSFMGTIALAVVSLYKCQLIFETHTNRTQRVWHT